MKFVWCGGGLQRPAWWRLFVDSWAQRRAERVVHARRLAEGVEHPTEWWL